MIINQDKEQLASELRGSLLRFTQFFYPLLTGRDFIVSNPIGRESHHITICRALTQAARLEIPNHRLLINVSPGSGKSTLLSMWVAWTLAQYPDSRFLYISYSKVIASKHTETIKRIMQLQHYGYLFDVKIRHDSKAREYFQTTAGGAVAAFGSSGSITGQDSGLPGLDRFSGAVICFPYDEYVHTENGAIKIGEIVEKKLAVNVYSVNLKTRKVELNPILDYYENQGSPIIEVFFSDGSTIRCTPEHKIWTDSRGWVEAKNLFITDKLPSPSPYGSLCNSKYLSRLSLGYSEVINNIKLVISEIGKFRIFSSFSNKFTCFFGFNSPRIASSNFLDSKLRASKFISKLFCAQLTKNKINDFFSRKSSAWMFFSHRKSAMINGIINIVQSSSIAKVFRPVIKSISVDMSNIVFYGLLAMKSPRNQLMNENISINQGGANSSPEIFPRRINSKFLDFLRLNSIRSIIPIINYSLLRSYSSKIRGAIKSVCSRDKFPVLIRYVGHTNKTYCINVKDNHNFFAGTCEDKYTLVKNCDDMHKPDEAHSATIRQSVIENYRETIQQRARGTNVPTIFIGQRLHEDDLPAYLIAGKDGYNWHKIILKSIDEAGNALYPEVNTLESLLIKKEIDPYVFASQYQQDPIPAGGALFKPEWFVLLDEEPEILYSFITCDTAETAKSYNDATVFGFFGVYEIESMGVKTGIHGLHWIDCIEIRVEPKDLKQAFIDFWSQCMRYKRPPQLVGIEKKSTGGTLLSLLDEIRTIRLMDIPRNANSGNKTKRFLDCQPYVAERKISLPTYGKHTKLCIDHMSKITANETHRWDDIGDVLSDAIKIALIDKTIISSTINAVDHSEIASRLMSKQSKINRLRDRRG